MWRLTKFIFLIGILAAIGLIAYAYVGPIVFPDDFSAPTEQVVKPVILDDA